MDATRGKPYVFIKDYAVMSLARVWTAFDFSGISRLDFMKSVRIERARLRAGGLTDDAQFSWLCANCNDIEDRSGAVTFSDEAEFEDEMANFAKYDAERQSEIANRRIKQWFKYHEAIIGPTTMRRNVKFAWI